MNSSGEDKKKKKKFSFSIFNGAKKDKQLQSTEKSGSGSGVISVYIGRNINKPVITILLMLLIFSAGGVILWRSNIVSKNKDDSVCSESTIKKSALVFEPEKFQELKTIGEEVLKTSRHETDPNCLYILVRYYVNAGDAENAQKNLDTLKTNFTKEVEFNPYFGNNVDSVDKLQNRVDYAVRINEDIKKNSLLIENIE